MIYNTTDLFVIVTSHASSHDDLVYTDLAYAERVAKAYNDSNGYHISKGSRSSGAVEVMNIEDYSEARYSQGAENASYD